VKHKTNNVDITNLLKNAQQFHAKGNLESALQLYNKILLLDPKNDEALHLLGVIAAQIGDFKQAVEKIDAAIKINPNDPSYYLNIGNALFSLKDYKTALSNFEKAIKLKENYAQAYSNRGNTFKEMGRLDLALESYDLAISFRPNYADAHYNKGIALHDLRKLEESLQSFKTALSFDPYNEEAYYNLGIVQHQLGALKDALMSYTNAIQLKKNNVEAYCGRGNIFRELKRYTESIKDFMKALEINPNHDFTKGYLLHAKMLSCDWDGIDDLINDIQAAISCRKKVADPFSWQAITSSIENLANCAKIYASAKHPPLVSFQHTHPNINKNKIKIGYVSGEFGDQATSHLLVGLLEKHDKSKFEIICFDNGRNDGSDLRKRIEKSIHGIFPIRNLTDESASQLIFEKEIDILINLNGYFGNERNNIFAKCPAPLQLNYLGFPGTIGTDYIDYIIADKIVIAENEKSFYSEKIIYMPDTYQPTDRNRIIAETSGTRRDYGLPNDVFIFCCFNNSYKITPEIFTIWMRILEKVNHSVIWLLEDNEETSAHLQKEACRRNVDPTRLIFAPRSNYQEHLARHAMADLFLDTLPCNAHTTASDALWAGVPLITCSGKTFSGRVAHSLLNAINLHELITHSLTEYEHKAIEIALNPKILSDLKSKLMHKRLTEALFDTELYTLNIEKAYETIYDRYRHGLTPESFDV